MNWTSKERGDVHDLASNETPVKSGMGSAIENCLFLLAAGETAVAEGGKCACKGPDKPVLPETRNAIFQRVQFCTFSSSPSES